MQQFVQVDVSMEGAPALKIVSVMTAGKETHATSVIETTCYLTCYVSSIVIAISVLSRK